MNRIELSSSAWKADALAIVLHSHKSNQRKTMRVKKRFGTKFLFFFYEVTLKPLLIIFFLLRELESNQHKHFLSQGYEPCMLPLHYPTIYKNKTEE